MKPKKADEIVARFHDALGQGLTSGGVTIVPTKTVRSRAKAPCARPGCASAPLHVLGAENAALCTIETVGKSYRFELMMVSKSGGRPLAKVSGRCDICTLMEALKTTRQLGAKLAQEGGMKAAAITLKPTPKVTPKTTPKPTPEPTSRPAVSTKTSQRSATSGRRWPLWPTLAAAGVGVLGLAVGIPLLSMDGDPTNCRGESRPDGRNCADVYSTSGAGWAMTTIGLAGLATAGVLAYLYFTSGQREKASAWLRGQRTVAVTPLEGGVMLGAGGTF